MKINYFGVTAASSVQHPGLVVAPSLSPRVACPRVPTRHSGPCPLASLISYSNKKNIFKILSQCVQRKNQNLVCHAAEAVPSQPVTLDTPNPSSTDQAQATSTTNNENIGDSLNNDGGVILKDGQGGTQESGGGVLEEEVDEGEINVEFPENIPYRFGLKAEQGLRDYMEDSAWASWDSRHGFLFMGCYDGHGGAASAQWLRARLHRRLSVRLSQGLSHMDDQLVQDITETFHEVDADLLRYLEQDEERKMTGSTGSVALVMPGKVVLANVGDSQAYILHSDRTVTDLAVPHRLSGSGEHVEAELARVRASGGWEYDGRVCNVLAVSRAFGDWEFKGKGLEQLIVEGTKNGYWPANFASRIAFSANPIIATPDVTLHEASQDEELLVLATDGLWDVVPAREALLLARKNMIRGMSPTQVAESLVQMALKRYTSDNTTVQVLDLKGEAYWQQLAAEGGGGGGLMEGLMSFFSK